MGPLLKGGAARPGDVRRGCYLATDRLPEGQYAALGFSNLFTFMRIMSNLTTDQAIALRKFTVEDFKDARGEDARDVRSAESCATSIRPCTHKSRLVSSGWSMSALPPKADNRQAIEHVCFVPKADF